MRDWLVILVIGLASLAIGFWAMRRRSATETPAPALSPRAAGPMAVPSTKVLPHPEDRPLAILDFDGPPGRVAVRRTETVIGRHSSDDIRVPDVRVSRHHARLVVSTGGSLEIHNLTAVRSEPNPMLVNGEPREHATIKDGDVVSLGGVNFRLMPVTE
ncbi:MAG: FHA domain-containing protein [Proteobacteria bacterium]|nr:FHA domain-containing protein [Pseudomonadota bacterium]